MGKNISSNLFVYFREIVLKGGDENYGNKYPENALEFSQNRLSLD